MSNPLGDYDFENSVGFWICTAAHDYQQVVNNELPAGITFRQAQVLGFLALAGPLAQNDLAERMRIEPPTLVGVLDRMERDGWIRRDSDPHDRRRKLIQPTPAAKPVWAKVVSVARRVREQATRGLSASQLAQLRKLLALVQTNLQPLATREAI
ncbi:MAG: MarR family transcriptional regulator [Pirellulaceae bacterium]|nr:MarR family transcriptional regulator [Pirellulaceae bacterium]